MAEIEDLLGFIAASPSPYHAVAEAVRRLDDEGFVEVDRSAQWPEGPGGRYVRAGGALVAWLESDGQASVGPWAGFRIVGTHTDSPNLRLKPHPDRSRGGWHQLAVEVYGGALWNSWLDRDLGLSGRVAVAGEAEPQLVRVDEPLARVPQLAIHLDRDVNTSGLSLNPQEHLNPVWATTSDAPDLRTFLADRLAVSAGDIQAWDLMFHDLTQPTILGVDRSLVAAPRLDNELSCWAALAALIEVHRSEDPLAGVPASVARQGVTPMVVMFDHEEVGSESTTGAAGPLLQHTIERIITARGGGLDDVRRALAASVCVSADGAHATHPNYQERHEPGHQITIDGGPVVKVNGNQRYATDAATAAVFLEACDRADVPSQRFVTRNDVPCGSTIGPITATRLGIATVDAGVAQLSMHSARELCGVADPVRFAVALGEFLRR